jgi:Zn-dependent peptidase ImmA (M78 family)
MTGAPYLKYEAIGKRADEFLKKYHPGLELPVPIEKIVEFDLKLDIIPMPNLFRDHDIEGFLTSDMTAIYVDNIQYEMYEQKYRFTLAHEVGHYVLHSKSLRDITWGSVEEYIKMRLSVSPRDIDWFEQQGHWFAEQVLLRGVVEDNRTLIKGIPADPKTIFEYLSNAIAPPFNVSPGVVKYRISRRDIEDETRMMIEEL